MHGSIWLRIVLMITACCGLEISVLAAEYRVGDHVEVTKPAELKIGPTVVGYVSPGDVFVVERVNDGWLWIEKNGKRAWLHSRNVRMISLSELMPAREPSDQSEYLIPLRTRMKLTPQSDVPYFDSQGPQQGVPFSDQYLPPDIDRPFEGRAGGRAIVIIANEFSALQNCGRAGRGIVIAGGDSGPNGDPGSASCTVELPDDASARTIMIGIHHGMPGEHGKGIHSKRSGGTVTVYINNVAVQTFKCVHQHMYNDFWPDPLPELGHDLPIIDLDEKRIKGRKLTITFKASGGACMDLRSVNVSFPEGAAGISGLVVAPQQFTPKSGHWFSQDMAAMVLNGGPPGPNDSAGAASCTVNLGEGVNRVAIFIDHGSNYGQGIHSTVQGGTLKVSINGVQVHTFTCKYRPENLKDYYPERVPAPTHRVSVDLRAQGIQGRELTIKFEAAARTCMDIQSVRIAPELSGELDAAPMPRSPVRERLVPNGFPVLPPRDRKF